MRPGPPSNASAGLTMTAGRIAHDAVASRSTASRRGLSGNAPGAITNSASRPERSSPIASARCATICLAVAIFTNGAKGHSALQLSRDLCCQYKTAFVLAHKLRELVGKDQASATLDGPGDKEIDGAYFGGGIKPANEVENRVDRRLAEEQTGKRQVVVVARERGGRTLPFIVSKESAAIPMIRQHVPMGATVHADEARGWDSLHAYFDMHRINHSEAYSKDGACTNLAESYFSRVRRVGDRHSSSHQRAVPFGLRDRNGVARGSSPRFQRLTVQHHRCAGRAQPRKRPMEPVLAAEPPLTDNGNRYALHALRERRAAIDGELRQCEQRLRHLREMLGHLDATLSLFDPEGNPKAIKPKKPYRRVKLFSSGALSRHILDAMREGGRPMTSHLPYLNRRCPLTRTVFSSGPMPRSTI